MTHHNTIFSQILKLVPRHEFMSLAKKHDGLIPAFAVVTRGKVGDQTQAKIMKFPKGSVLVFDRGYMDYKWHN